MTAVLDELLTLLELEKIEENLFRGQSQDLGFGALFGGQVLGQALSAAHRTVTDDRAAHSLHAYFLRPGDSSRPVVYQVDPIRDGGSISTRRVVAIQHGKAICAVMTSFQEPEQGYEHQDEMPDVPGPEGVKTQLERVREYADKIPEPFRTKMLCDKPIEIRSVDPVDPFAPVPREPRKDYWLRAAGELPDDPAVHQYLLAYASDFGLVGTALYPHARTYWDPSMQVASIDHAMWFHRDFRMDDWLLHSMDSPRASGARGLNRGQIFTRRGELVTSVTQEGLMRPRKKR